MRAPKRIRAALAMLLVAVLWPAAAQAATAPAAAASVTISPLPGTIDASDATQISFLGEPAKDLRDIVVRGSQSGAHAGKLESYSQHDGASFLPTVAFTQGEQVVVSAQLSIDGKSVPLATHFSISDPYVLPSPGKPSIPTPTAAAEAQTLHFHSRHDLSPPLVAQTASDADPTLGDLFIAPDTGPGQHGPMIIDPGGQLLWFTPMPLGTVAMDFREQTYEGHPVLTWWQGQIIGGHGQGEDIIENSDYAPVAQVHAGNGLYADLHDFALTPHGTAWITAYAPVHVDLSSIGGPKRGLVDDGVIQEIDVKTGLVMFEWHALNHVSLSATNTRVPHLESSVLDYFHLNSIQVQPDGDILISARSTWAAYLISASTGAIEWSLGGKTSTFALGPGVRFAWQHDVEMVPGGNVSIFDNEDTPPEGTQSRAIVVSLNLQAHTASLVRQIVAPGAAVLSPSQGNVQLLSNSDEMVGFGQTGSISEFSSAGQVTWALQVPVPGSSYRAYRYPWTGTPSGTPNVAASAGPGGTSQIYASWNGASAVASWRVLGGSSPAKLVAVTVVPRTGFETSLVARTAGPYIAVQALNLAGQVLGTSPPVKE